MVYGVQCTVDQKSTTPGAEGSEGYEDEETPVPPAVEDVTCYNDKRVLQTQFECVADFGIAYRPINQKDERQKEGKFDRVK